MEIKAIATMKSDFPEKFGIPRQSGLVSGLYGRVVFEKEYAVPEAIRGLDGYSHIWLIWGFSLARRDGWSPTVRPPRLGGNTRMGVFATRSPFRPNPLGLSCVRLVGIENGELIVEGADLADGTPIYDIKPYLPYADAKPEAVGGFASAAPERRLTVGGEALTSLPPDKREALIGVLACDPRPSYQDDPERVYGFSFAGYEVKFRVEGDKAVVTEIEKAEK